MDSLLQITIWRGWQELVSEFDLAVIERSEGETGTDEPLDPRLSSRLLSLDAGLSAADLDELQPGRGGRIFRLPVDPIPISSSAIRARSRANLDIENLVPPAVAGYIQRSGLYRREDTR